MISRSQISLEQGQMKNNQHRNENMFAQDSHCRTRGFRHDERSEECSKGTSFTNKCLVKRV
jgi:hypothetical protein